MVFLSLSTGSPGNGASPVCVGIHLHWDISSENTGNHRTDRVVLIASWVLGLSPIFYKSQGTLKSQHLLHKNQGKLRLQALFLGSGMCFAWLDRQISTDMLPREWTSLTPLSLHLWHEWASWKPHCLSLPLPVPRMVPCRLALYPDAG